MDFLENLIGLPLPLLIAAVVLLLAAAAVLDNLPRPYQPEEE